MKYLTLILFFIFINCKNESLATKSENRINVSVLEIRNNYIETNSKLKNDKTTKELVLNHFQTNQIQTKKLANGFDFPVGKPNADGYYNAQKFGKNNHLGDDWNGINGGNTDLGDPIYAIANGYVSFAKNIEGGWGNVIRITHYLKNEKQIESLYAHCHKIEIKEGDYVNKGDLIGTIGNNNGQYLAHLHLELRSQVGLPIGGGYSSNTEGYLDATEYINNNRK